MKRLNLFSILLITSFLLLSQDHDLPNHFRKLSISYPQSVFFKGPDNTKVLALTFDDGPSEITLPILDLLDRYHVKATFFWQGKNLIKYPEAVNRAIKAGHEVGNHSWDHPNCYDMSPTDLWSQQLLPTFSVYDSLFNIKPKSYRPPYGAVTENQLAHLVEKDVQTILWSVSTLDWDVKRNSSKELVERFEQGLHPGAIILLHDVDFNNTAPSKLQAIEKMIKKAEKENYSFMTVSDMMNATK